jgi:hypothetical protein
MTRKTTDDPAARDYAERKIGAIMAESHGGDGETIVGAFKTAEFETASPKVGGETVEMHRVVLTGPWEPVRK